MTKLDILAYIIQTGFVWVCFFKFNFEIPSVNTNGKVSNFFPILTQEKVQFGWFRKRFT